MTNIRRTYVDLVAYEASDGTIYVKSTRDRVPEEYVPAALLDGADTGAVEAAARDLLRVLDRYDNAPVSAVNAIDRLRVVLGGG